MRHTFGTHLSKGGVAPRGAQAAMRHSSMELTMNVYTDPRLLDVHGSLDSLPALSLDGVWSRNSADNSTQRFSAQDDSWDHKISTDEDAFATSVAAQVE